MHKMHKEVVQQRRERTDINCYACRCRLTTGEPSTGWKLTGASAGSDRERERERVTMRWLFVPFSFSLVLVLQSFLIFFSLFLCALLAGPYFLAFGRSFTPPPRFPRILLGLARFGCALSSRTTHSDWLCSIVQLHCGLRVLMDEPKRWSFYLINPRQMSTQQIR